MKFPDGFQWGVATASYQIEGAVQEGGRAPSIWDTFSHTPGATLNGDTGDVADDHYHRWPEDLEILSDLGVDLYRFSLAWPRLQPDGRGALNEAGVDFYSRLVDGLLERGVQPWITLYHWDLPQALQDEGGWPARDTAERFAEYAAARPRAAVGPGADLDDAQRAVLLGPDRARRGAPRARRPGRRAAMRAAHHLLLGHGLAVRGDARGRPRGSYGLTLNLTPPTRRATTRPTSTPRGGSTRSPTGCSSIRCCSAATPTTCRRCRCSDGDLEVIAAAARRARRQLLLPPARAGGGRTAPAPSPWVGARDVKFLSRGLPRTEMGWEIDASGLHDMLTRVHRDYPSVPLYVTENGAAFPTWSGDGRVEDPDRIAYLDAHFRAAAQAIADGVDLRGYFVWTLMDNFEWAYGYTKRFGLVHVDYETLERTPKESARWFAEVTRRNGV